MRGERPCEWFSDAKKRAIVESRTAKTGSRKPPPELDRPHTGIADAHLEIRGYQRVSAEHIS